MSKEQIPPLDDKTLADLIYLAGKLIICAPIAEPPTVAQTTAALIDASPTVRQVALFNVALTPADGDQDKAQQIARQAVARLKAMGLKNDDQQGT